MRMRDKTDNCLFAYSKLNKYLNSTLILKFLNTLSIVTVNLLHFLYVHWPYF